MENNKLSFIYMIIFIIIIGILSNNKNNVFYLLAFLILFVLYNNGIKIDNKEINNKNNHNKKTIGKKKLMPQPKNINKYEDLEIFVFNIQEFIYFNHPAFEEMVDHLDNFLEYYDICIKVNKKANMYYHHIEKAKHESLNALHSIIFETPSSPQIIEKLNMSIKELDKILTKYLSHIQKIIEDDIILNGYNNSSIIINKGPKEFNFYENKPFMYDFI